MYAKSLAAMRIGTCLVALVAPLLPAQAPKRFRLVAAPGTISIEPGRSVGAWTYNGQLPGPTLRVTEGDRVQITFVNNTPDVSIVHWHGLQIPSGMDGVPGISRPAVEPGQEFTYDFIARPAGTHMFHSHSRFQMDRGLYGALIIDPKNGGDPRFDREYTVVLDDWLSGAPVAGRDPVYSTYLINGKTSVGQAPLRAKLGDRIRLRFINASSGTNYVVALDGHPMTVTHTDGHLVRPVTVDAIPIGIGERYDVIVNANNTGAWSIAAAGLRNRSRTLVRAILAYDGSTAPIPSPTYVPPFLSSGRLLSYSQLASASPVPPISLSPNRTHDLTLAGGMMSYVWTINAQAYPAAPPLPVQAGESVRMILRNRSMHDHPMHIHGHVFRLLNTAGGTTAPPVKDTVLVPRGMMSGAIHVETIADNPGNWAFHCHHLYHSEAGMFRLVQYVNGDADADGLADGDDLDPLSAYPVLATDALGQGYRVGTITRLDVQWRPGEVVDFFVGLESPPVHLGLLGRLELWPFVGVGRAVVDQTRYARVPLAIPNATALRGVRVAFQAVATHATLSPGARISTRGVVVVR